MVHVRGQRVARQLRMNLGTIVETPMLKVRLRGGPVLGEVEEWFVSTLEPGDMLHLRRPDPALRGAGCDERHRLPRWRGRAARPRLCRRPPAADAPGWRRGCGRSCTTRRNGGCCPSPCATGCGCSASASALPEKRRAAGRDVPARRPLVHGRLLLRGAAGAPDARHAGDQADGARRLRPDRLPRHRLRAGDLVGLRADRGGERCSRRTSSARTSRSGWRRAPCSAAPSATSPPLPG